MSSKSKKRRIQISYQDRVQFWSIFATGLVGLFSLWLGITIQDDINTKNARETQKLARYQMAEAIYPKFVEYIDTCGYVFYDLLEITNAVSLSQNTEDDVINSVGVYYEKQQIPFIETMNNTVNYMNDNQYYLGAIFGKKLQERICTNNASILFGLRLLKRNNEFLFTALEWQDRYQDAISRELSNAYYIKNTITFKDEVTKGVSANYKMFCDGVRDHKNDTTTVVNHAVYQFLFLPYIDNFNILSQELVPTEDVTSHMGKHIVLLVGCVLLGLLLFVLLLRHVFGVSFYSQEKEILEEKENPLS